jgi:deoxycytidylate deaminase
MYVVHAEMNAILNKNSSSVSGARMYVVRNLEENTHTHSCAMLDIVLKILMHYYSAYTYLQLNCNINTGLVSM